VESADVDTGNKSMEVQPNGLTANLSGALMKAVVAVAIATVSGLNGSDTLRLMRQKFNL
jgi:hypothetical protein